MPSPRQFRRKLITLVVTAVISLAGGFLYYSGKVVRVADGDTITVLLEQGTETVRLYGVDCPEKRQPGGEEATAFMRDLLLFSSVTLVDTEKDQYGRTVAIVRLPDGRTANEELVRSGHAWVYRAFCHAPVCSRWLELEQEARAQRRGLWQRARPVPPWQWRRSGAR